MYMAFPSCSGWHQNVSYSSVHLWYKVYQMNRIPLPMTLHCTYILSLVGILLWSPASEFPLLFLRNPPIYKAETAFHSRFASFPLSVRVQTWMRLLNEHTNPTCKWQWEKRGCDKPILDSQEELHPSPSISGPARQAWVRDRSYGEDQSPAQEWIHRRI